jgi:hypothetical protein
MLLKKVFLYDAVNDPLQVPGIRIELYDSMKNSLIDHDISRDLKPQPSGYPSDFWGVELNYPSGRTPVDILVLDPSYTYPGNSLRYLNGDLSDEVYMDLLQLPSGPGGGKLPISATLPAINKYINESPNWSTEGKEAVRGLIFNYAHIIGSVGGDARKRSALGGIAKNWELAAQRIGVPQSVLSASVGSAAQQATASY